MFDVLKERLAKYGLLLTLLGLIVVALFHACSVRSYQKQIAQLQNDLAAKDKTLEVQKDLYTKLTVQTQNIQGSLDQKDSQVKELEDQVNKQKQQLLDATSLVVTWKKAYEGLANASQTEVPVDTKNQSKTQVTVRDRVDFHEDFGYIKADGWTLTNPAQAYLKLTQGRPLKVTLALSQDSSKAWHTYATSSEDNVGVDIQVSSVNPFFAEPHWYEHIGIAVDLGLGTNTSGINGLIGAGLNYEFLQYTIGPSMWITTNNDKYYGLSFQWRPLQRR